MSNSSNSTSYPATIPYYSIFIISATLLCYEILLMRLFSIIQWSHFSYMFISLAILGIAISGTFISLYQDWCNKHFITVFITSYTLFGLSAIACFFIVQNIPFHQQTLLWSYQTWLQFFVIFLLLLIPFFFSANCTVLCLKYFSENIPAIYGVNLLGSGFGAGIVIILLELVNSQVILVALAVVAISTAAIASYELTTKVNWRVSLIITSLIILIFSLSLHQQPLNINHYKSLHQSIQLPKAKITHQLSSPKGLLSVVESPVIPFRSVAGLSLLSTAPLPNQLGLFVDANHFSAINQFTSGKLEKLQYLADTTSALAYQVIANPHQLILGLGGGSTLLQAYYHQANNIDIIEPNPQIITLFTQTLAAYTNWKQLSQIATIYNQSFRSYFFTFPNKRYNIIQLDFLDGGMIGSNIYSLSENYNYTTEALNQYWQALTPEGVIQFTQWLDLPARGSLKLINTIKTMLNQQGIDFPANHLAIIRSWKTITILLSKQPLSETQIDKIINFCNSKGFDVVYFPSILPKQTNRFNIITEPTFFNLVSNILTKDHHSFISSYKFNISPTTDSKPFFNHFFKWQSFNEFITLAKQGGISLIETSYLLQLIILSICVLFSALLIIIPLLIRRKKFNIRDAFNNSPLYFIDYFLLIGVSFFFIEIAFIQYFILWFDSTLIAVTIITCSFLMFSGAGSLLANSLIRHFLYHRIIINIAIGSLLLSLALLWLSLPQLFEWLKGSSLLIKSAIAALSIAPLAIAMGFPFAVALASIQSYSDQLIPWAWSINNSASVTSILLAPIVAINIGFSSLLIIGGCCYLVAAYAFHKLNPAII